MIEDKEFLAKSYFIQGIKAHKNNDLKLAKKFYQMALNKNPNYLEVNLNLGILHNQLDEFSDALNYYKKVLQTNPTYIDALYNLGNVYKKLKQYQKSINCYKKVIQLDHKNIAAYNNLGNLFKDIGEYQNAMNCYKKSIQINQNNVVAYYNLGSLFKELGEYKNAKNCFEKAIEKEPNNLMLQWQSMNIFPVIYKKYSEIENSRKKFEDKIKKINELIKNTYQYSNEHLINSIMSSTNFFLHYQGKDDLKLQKLYASLVEQLTKKIYPNLHKIRKKKNSQKFISIGFISSFFREHTISKLFKNWVIKLNNNKFKKYVYYTEDKTDHVTNYIRSNVDFFYQNTDVNKLIDRISKDNLDLIIYLDIGMMPKIQILSSLRLAPIQCNTWGHPVTSGFKNIDYFISSELMEKQGSEKYYSEKLIKLPGIGINYDLPDLSKIKKKNTQKKSNVTAFLNLQSLFKLLPQDDHIYLDIIQKHPNSCFYFIEGIKSSMTLIFKERISKLFKKEGHDYKKFFHFYPRCSQDKFFQLIHDADIILDSFNWSGGNTSLEAISMNKPIVTYPSNFMRGRHTYGILKFLELEETIANSKQNYVDIAVKLAKDLNFRNLVIKKIKTNKKKLFSDRDSIKFFENLLINELNIINDIKTTLN